ncbi:hypothetical protein CYMTET_51373 [Cymbomonas tetramitiformis]|uniref:Uncharacterized protein n=1 Tax=Cymbomonas tetramitiformis TaxID=36881 RepID=A0AAE0BL75_9CHLO|nr:hypothetical protein CYMTET_51373 [Cymbomonas tetramitiformis]
MADQGSVAPFAHGLSIKDELRHQANLDMGIILTSYGMMFVYVAIVCSEGLPPVRSSFLLSLFGIFTTGVSVVSALALSSWWSSTTPVGLQASRHGGSTAPYLRDCFEQQVMAQPAIT